MAVKDVFVAKSLSVEDGGSIEVVSSIYEMGSQNFVAMVFDLKSISSSDGTPNIAFRLDGGITRDTWIQIYQRTGITSAGSLSFSVAAPYPFVRFRVDFDTGGGVSHLGTAFSSFSLTANLTRSP